MNQFAGKKDQPSQPTQPAVSERTRLCGVALDMDGLLFDTEGLYSQVGDRILQRRGRRFCAELKQRMMGRVGVVCMQQMVDFHSLSDSAEALLEESDTLYAELLAGGVEPMPGLADWIDLLHQSGLHFGVATSSRRRFVDMILPTYDWSNSLSFVITGDDVVNGKPAPEIYLRAADKMGIDPMTMLVLEDSGNGCAAAVAAGAYTVAVPSEHTRDHSFAGAKLVAHSLTDPRLAALLQ
jgi:HAD superfamily hydrolase (TIGR01509 family)